MTFGNWLRRLRAKPPEEIKVTGLRFLAEQDGPSERILKGELSRFFDADGRIGRAYLVRAQVRDEFSIVLCLCATAGPSADLVSRVQSIFARIFSTDQHLDIMFPSQTKEEEVQTICRPFFESVRAGAMH